MKGFKMRGWSPFNKKNDDKDKIVIKYDKKGKMITSGEPTLEGITKDNLIKNWNKNPRSKNVNFDKKPNIRKNK
tara:strand:+ start:4932 stop:5153 length:222 start_codon:yes stop_codon:yes gene_type:complete